MTNDRSGIPSRKMEVVVSQFNDEYHWSKSGYYCECGADFNPHHADTIPREEAEAQGLEPCSECGFPDPDSYENDRPDTVQRQIDANYNNYDDYEDAPSRGVWPDDTE